MKAVAVLKGEADVNGNVTFSQEKEGSPVSIQVSLSGLKPGPHGFHIHEFGDNTGGCASTGGIVSFIKNQAILILLERLMALQRLLKDMLGI